MWRPTLDTAAPPPGQVSLIFIAIFGFVHMAARLRMPTSKFNAVIVMGLVAFLAPVASAEPQSDDVESQEEHAKAKLDMIDAINDRLDAIGDREERWLHF